MTAPDMFLYTAGRRLTESRSGLLQGESSFSNRGTGATRGKTGTPPQFRLKTSSETVLVANEVETEAEERSRTHTNGAATANSRRKGINFNPDKATAALLHDRYPRWVARV